MFLSDVSIGSADGNDQLSRQLKESRWFTRGWTLQELIAPTSVEFFSKEQQRLGDKRSFEKTLNEITGVAIEALRGRPISDFSISERMSWAEKRETICAEDVAYCLLSIFGIHIPLIYGEGQEKAMSRLRKEVKESSEVTVPQLE